MKDPLMEIVRRITGIENDIERLKTVEMGGGLVTGQTGLYRYATDNISSEGLPDLTTGDLNLALGAGTGSSLTTGDNNCIVGSYAGELIDDGVGNALFGSYAGTYIEGGDYNTIIGDNAGYRLSGGSYNLFAGYVSADFNVAGNYNVVLGAYAGLGSYGDSYSNAVIIGYEAGYSNEGDGCVFIGYNAGYDETGSNKLYIENSDSATPLIHGDFSADELTVNGHLEVTEQIAITSSALLGTPEAGTFEFYNDRMYVTNVATARPIDRTSDVITSTFTLDGDAAVHGTTETTVWTGTLAANALKAGNVIKVMLSGEISNANAASDLTIKKYIGSTLLEEFTPEIGNVTDALWHIENVIVVRSVGSSGTIAFHGHITIDGNEDTVNGIFTPIDTTAAEDITITMQWESADAANLVDVEIGFMEFKN